MRLPLIAVLCLVALQAHSAEKRTSLSILGGVPHPINVGLDYRLGKRFSLGVGAGMFGLDYKFPALDKFHISTFNVEGRLRWHPFGGSFFLGTAGGWQQWTGSATKDIPIVSGVTFPVTGTVDLTSYYLTPHFGWWWATKSGALFGLEFGCQFSFSPKTAITIPVVDAFAPELRQTSEFQKLESDAQNMANQIGTQTLPFVTLLRLGWIF